MVYHFEDFKKLNDYAKDTDAFIKNHQNILDTLTAIRNEEEPEERNSLALLLIMQVRRQAFIDAEQYTLEIIQEELEKIRGQDGGKNTPD